MERKNAGFSLVELIIVMAIMAILIGALVPQYMKYVVQARKSSDVRTIDGISSAAIVTSQDEEYYGRMGSGEYIITFTNRTYSGMTGPDQDSIDALKEGIESITGDFSDLSLKNSTWGTLEIHMEIGAQGEMKISYTNTGTDSYEDYIAGK